jgi:hypothetical protein
MGLGGGGSTMGFGGGGGGLNAGGLGGGLGPLWAELSAAKTRPASKARKIRCRNERGLRRNNMMGPFLLETTDGIPSRNVPTSLLGCSGHRGSFGGLER